MNDSPVHRDVTRLLDSTIAVNFSDKPVNIGREKDSLECFQEITTTTHGGTARTYLNSSLHRLMSVVELCTYHAYSL